MNDTFVKLPRWITDDLTDSNLTVREFAALVKMWAHADHRTGGGRITAAYLLTLLGSDRWFGEPKTESALRTAQRVLTSLYRKGYIWYRPLQGVYQKQPYWLHGYPLPERQKGVCRSVDLTQLINRQSLNQEDIENFVGATVGAPVGATVGATDDNNKNSITQELNNSRIPSKDSIRGAPPLKVESTPAVTPDSAGEAIATTTDRFVAGRESVVLNMTKPEPESPPDPGDPPQEKNRIKVQGRVYRDMDSVLEDSQTQPGLYWVLSTWSATSYPPKSLQQFYRESGKMHSRVVQEVK